MRGGEERAAGAAAGQRLRVESMLVDGDRYRVQAPALGGATVVGVSGVLECDCADALLREYVRACFCPMDDAVRPLVERGVLPLATYVLPDGRRWCPLITPRCCGMPKMMLMRLRHSPAADSSPPGATREPSMRSTRRGCRASMEPACTRRRRKRSSPRVR